MNRSRLCSVFSRRAAGWSVVVVAVAGVGCDRQDPVANAIDAAHAEARLLSNTAESTFWQRNAAERAGTIVAERGLTGDSTQAREQAAALVLANGYRGQAMLPLQSVQRLELQSRRHASTIRGLLGQYDRLSSLATATEESNTRELAAEIERLRAEIIDLRESASGRLVELNGQLEDARARFNRLSTRAAEQRELAGELYLRLGSVEPEERIRLSQEAEAYARTAATYERDADEVRVRVDQLEPRAAEVRLRVAEFEGQLESLNETLALSEERVRNQRQSGLEARAAATEAAERLADELSALQSLREGELVSAHEDAVSLLEQALGAARRTDRRSVGGLTLAGVQQALGDLSLTAAHGLGSYAEVLEMLSTAVPALPGSARLAEAAEAARQAEAEALSDAAERLTEAADAYESVRASDRDADAIEHTVATLRDIAATLRGEPAGGSDDDSGDGSEGDDMDESIGDDG